jgi:hypothetical protein
MSTKPVGVQPMSEQHWRSIARATQRGPERNPAMPCGGNALRRSWPRTCRTTSHNECRGRAPATPLYPGYPHSPRPSRNEGRAWAPGNVIPRRAVRPVEPVRATRAGGSPATQCAGCTAGPCRGPGSNPGNASSSVCRPAQICCSPRNEGRGRTPATLSPRQASS